MRLVLALVLVVAACKKDNKPAATGSAAAPAASSDVCEKYAKFEIECGGAGEGARPTILDFCAKARAGAKEVTYQLIALESTCAAESADCPAYKACVEKKKAETSPQ